jgi:hypothetical protein
MGRIGCKLRRRILDTLKLLRSIAIRGAEKQSKVQSGKNQHRESQGKYRGWVESTDSGCTGMRWYAQQGRNKTNYGGEK